MPSNPSPTSSAPSAGAMRAARALWPYGVSSYCFETEEQNAAARLRDWEMKAHAIDRETDLPELARDGACLDYIESVFASGDEKAWDELVSLACNAGFRAAVKTILSRHA